MTTALRPRSTADDQQDERLARHQEIMALKTRDLADLSDAEFEKGIQRVLLRQQRMKRLMDDVLIENVHYGREKDTNGNPVFKKDRLKKAGAEELRTIVKLTCRDVAEPMIVATAEACYVIVNRGIYDAFGNCLATARAACHTKEKRFKGRGGGWTYTDPREELHNCVSMANKRADSSLTSEATGATGHFSDGEDLEDALNDDKPMVPWTDDEKKIVGEAAAKKGMGRNAYSALIEATLGRQKIGTGDDVVKVLNAIATWVKPGTAGDSPKRPNDIPAAGLDPLPADTRTPEEIEEEKRLAAEESANEEA